MNIWIISKRNGILILLLILVVTAGVIFGKTGVVSVGAKQKELPIYCVDKGDEKVISISFDAAWGNEDTNELISILEKYNVKATFFVVGEWADKYPDSVKALSNAGHEVMNHSNTHPHMTELNHENVIKEITECNNKIEAITGIKPILLRVPYGDYNNDVIKTVNECSCYPIQWSIDSLDWKDISADEICNRVIKKAHPGGIVLFHNAAKNTPEALPRILEKLQSDGYNIIPISQLIYANEYKIDSTGKQCRINE